jgi:Fe-S cluster assembly protein SufD
VHVPKDVVLEQPLMIRIVNSVDGGALFWRLLIVADPGSRFSVIEEYASTTPELSGYVNAAVEIFVADGARVEYVSVQNVSQETWHFGTSRPRRARCGARLGCGRLRLEEGQDPDPERPRRARGDLAGHGRLLRGRQSASGLRHFPGAHRA